MMKRILTFMLTVSVMACMFAGCSGSNRASEELSAAEVGDYIGQAASFDNMKQRELENLQELYRIDAEKVEEFVLYTSSSNVKADELAIIKVKDANEVEGILASIQKRIEAQTAKFQDYLPEEVYLIEKHVLKSKGRLILFAVSEEADRIDEAFEKALK